MPVQPKEISPTISTRFDPDTLARLNEIAAKQNRSRSEIIKEAVGGYLDSMAWFEREVQKGLDDIKAGRVVSHEEVVESIRRLGLNVR
jgi:Predicted transcriptional regulator